MPTPASRSDSVSWPAWHLSNCPKSRVLKKMPCYDALNDGECYPQGWPEEWAKDQDVLMVEPRIGLFAGRTCLEAFRAACEMVERN